jgi:calcineurin-like phosphoesterase family protein
VTIFLISDTHFHHSNILGFVDSKTGEKVRPMFSSVDEMDEHMIEKWNSVVQKGDKVYHLGDVFIGHENRDKFRKLWARLNGQKNLIVGNHDDIKFLCAGGFFSSVYLERKLPELGVHLSHIPLHHSQLERGAPGSGKFLVNVHGHTHSNGSPKGLYTSVCVELRNYTPVAVEDLQGSVKKKLEDFYANQTS